MRQHTEHRRRMEPDYPPGVTRPPSRYKTGYGDEGYIITPPWSTITAYDLNTGKIMWQTPYGDLPQARERHARTLTLPSRGTRTLAARGW